MELGILNYSISGDNTKLLEALEEAKRKATELQKSLVIGSTGSSGNLNGELQGATNSAKNLAESINNVGRTTTKSFSNSSSEVRNLQRAIKEMETLYDNLPNKEGKVGTQLTEKIEKLKQEISSLSGVSIGGVDDTSIKKMEENLGNLINKYKLLSEEQRKSPSGMNMAESIRSTQDSLSMLKRQFSDVRFTGAEDSIKSLKANLKELEEQYSKLSRNDRTSSTGDALLSKMKGVRDAIDSAQASLNRMKETTPTFAPTSFNMMKEDLKAMTEEYKGMSKEMRDSDYGTSLSKKIRETRGNIAQIEKDLKSVNDTKVNIDIPSTSIRATENSLSEMINRYKTLSAEDREGNVGKTLERNIGEARQQLEKLSAEMKNLGVNLGGENSLLSMKSNLSSMRSQYERMSEAQRGSSEGLQLANNIKNTTQQVNEEYKKLSPNIDGSTKSLGRHYSLLNYVFRRAVAYVSIWQTTAMLRNIVQTTGEFEKQKVALEGMLQNTAAAYQLFQQIKGFSVVSPFNFKDLISQAKQLSAYSVPSQNIFTDLKKLGDIAAGTGSDMSRLILAYGEVNTQTVLNGRVLRQFTQTGVPLVDSLATHFTKLKGEVVTTGDVFDMVSKKQVTFQDVDQALSKMTGKGGMFYQMQERQADTLAGKLSNLKDKWDIFASEFGESHGGMINGLVDASSDILEHWQSTVTVIKTMIALYGEYKAAMIIGGMLAKRKLATDIEDLAVQKAKNAVAGGSNASMIGAAGMSGAVGGILAGVAVVTTLIGVYQAYKADQKARTDKIFEEINAVDQSAIENNKLIEKLKELSSASDSNASAMQERKEILDKLAQTEPQLSDSIANHTNNVNELTKAQKLYNETQEVKKTFKFSIVQEGGLKEAEQGLKEAKNAQRNATSEIEIAYSKLYNTVKSYKSAGIKNFGIEKIDDSVLDSINKILDGSGKMQDKLEQIRAFGIGSYQPYELLDKTNVLGSLSDYDETIPKVKEAQAIFNEELKKSGTLIKDLAKIHNININTDSGKAAIASVVQDEKSLSEETRKELVQYIKLKWANGDPYKLLSGWRKDLQDYLGKSNIIIRFDDNLDDVIKGVQQQDKMLRENMAQKKPILIKFGIKDVTDINTLKSALFKLNLTPDYLRTPQQRVQIATLQSQIADIENLNKIQGAKKTFGLPDEKEATKPKKAASPKDDPIIKGLRVQEEAIKNVRSEYEKLVKVESSEAAISQLKKQGAFKGGVTPSILPIGDDLGYERWIETAIKKAHTNIGKKKYNQNFIKSYLNDLNKELQNAKIDVLVNSVEYKIKDIESELSAYKPQWSLYKQLLGITGDKETSLKVAFGNINAKSLIEYQKDEINKALKETKSTVSLDELLKMTPTDIRKNKVNDSIVSMVKELKSTMQEENVSNITSLSNVVQSYGTIEEKIQTVRNKNNLLREELSKNTSFSPEQKKAIGLAIDEKDKKEIQDLRKTAFELTPIYQKLFGDISSMSNSSLSKVIEQSKEFAKNLSEVKDSTGKTTGFQYNTGKKDEKGNDIINTISIESYTSFMKQIGVAQKDMYKADPFAKITAGFKKIKAASKDADEDLKKTDRSDGIKMIAEGIGKVADQASSSASALGGMFDSLGNESAADAMATISGVASGIGNIANGIASGNPAQVIQGVAGAISTLAQAHDKKLNAAIGRSKERVKELEIQYTDLERIIKRQLGAQTTEQSNKMLSNYKTQLSELNGQLSDQEAKKKKDKAAIADTKEQIEVLNDKVKYFYEDLEKEQFGVDIKDWAGQIADALTNAFATGSNAAAAFDDTVASIMRNVVKSLISVNLVQPAMENLRKYLFGDGKSKGVFSDSNLSVSDLQGMIPYMQGLSSTINASQDLWDGVKKAATQAGINLSGGTSSSGITASEQSLTENTGNILSGYINNIRIDVAANGLKLDNLIIIQQSHQVSFSSMLTSLKLISQNTSVIASNTAYSKMIYDFIHDKLCLPASGTKINI